MCVDASGGLLAAGAADGSTRVWDTEGFFCTHVFTGHRQVSSNSSGWSSALADTYLAAVGGCCGCSSSPSSCGC